MNRSKIWSTFDRDVDIGVRAPLDLGGGGDLIARKKLHNARNNVVVQTHSNHSNSKDAPNSYV